MAGFAAGGIFRALYAGVGVLAGRRRDLAGAFGINGQITDTGLLADGEGDAVDSFSQFNGHHSAGAAIF